jgi:hypothetical protein
VPNSATFRRPAVVVASAMSSADRFLCDRNSCRAPSPKSPMTSWIEQLTVDARESSPRRSADGRRAPQLKKGGNCNVADAAHVLLNEAARQQAVAPVIKNIATHISHEPTRTMVVPRS